jgi:uncharacterized protein YidB (DUF937 family)
MTLIDTISSLFGKSSSDSGGSHGIFTAVLELINNNPGGLNGIIQQFEQKGAGGIIQSWVSNGENQPISSDQLRNVLGSDVISGLAQKAGIDPDQASGLISQALPHVVNAATPEGTVPAEGKLNTESVLGTLGGLASLLGKKGDKAD